MQITYWSDYACPFCYIGEGFLKQAIAKLDTKETFEFVMKAFQLDPGAPLKAEKPNIERTMAKYHMTREQAEARLAQMNAMAAAAGLEFNYATALNTNTMDAHRLTKLAQSKGSQTAEKVTEALFRAYFIENKELANRQTLLQIAEASGLDRAETEAMLDSDRFREDVIRDEREADYYGIHSVPFFVIGKYGISGAQDPQYLAAALKQIAEEEE